MSNIERKFNKQSNPGAWQLRIKTDPSAELAHMTNPDELREQSVSTPTRERMNKWEKGVLAAVALAGIVVGVNRFTELHSGDKPNNYPSNDNSVVETQGSPVDTTHHVDVSTPDGKKTMSFELPPTETAGPALPPPPEQYAPGEQPDIEH
jgi:hypothetical protein